MTNPNDNPVLVVGIFRSGTSLLCSLLNQNPKVALMYECDIWNFPRPLLSYRFHHNWAERIEFYNQALSRHGLVTRNGSSTLKDIHTPHDLYHAFGKIKQATVCGEKSPFYCSRLEQLHRQQPSTLFILVWRNPVEVYRSVLKAGQTSRFFGKPGMLSRMIYHQEQAIRQAERIEKKGARVFRVDYADIVDHTEKVCRELCTFLGVDFHPYMLELNKADLSSIYVAPHHAYLRRGVIERQKYHEELVSTAIQKKLDRYRRRWEKRQAGWLKPKNTTAGPEPGSFEFVRHHLTGRVLTDYDSLVRAGFEFLPLPWLRMYRLLKAWYINPPTGDVDEKTSIFRDFQIHWHTISVAALLLALVGEIHAHSNPHLMFVLFYALPCALVALVVNTRWATLFALAAAIIAPLIQYDSDTDYQNTGVMAWNLISRFILLEIIVITLGRIRREFTRLEK